MVTRISEELGDEFLPYWIIEDVLGYVGERRRVTWSQDLDTRHAVPVGRLACK